MAVVPWMHHHCNGLRWRLYRRQRLFPTAAAPTSARDALWREAAASHADAIREGHKVRCRKVKAHFAERHASVEHPLEDIRGNQRADELAGSCARWHLHQPAVVLQLQAARREAVQTLRAFGTMLALWPPTMELVW